MWSRDPWVYHVHIFGTGNIGSKAFLGEGRQATSCEQGVFNPVRVVRVLMTLKTRANPADVVDLVLNSMIGKVRFPYAPFEHEWATKGLGFGLLSSSDEYLQNVGNSSLIPTSPAKERSCALAVFPYPN